MLGCVWFWLSGARVVLLLDFSSFGCVVCNFQVLVRAGVGFCGFCGFAVGIAGLTGFGIWGLDSCVLWVYGVVS